MRLFYRKMGAGIPMIILHGLYGSSDNWLSIASKLSSRFTVYLVDLRNHGRSPHDSRHNYELMRDDILGFMNERSLEKAILAGHSMGGKAAMCFAAHHPGRISHLVVVDIAPKSYKDLYRSEPLSHYDILKAMDGIDFSVVTGRRDVDRLLAVKIRHPRIRNFLMKNLRQKKDKTYFWGINLKVLSGELDNIMDGVNENCFNPSVPAGEFPVLFIKGMNSPYIADDDMTLIRNIFPSAEIVTIPDAGHWLHAEQPGKFIEAVNRFVSGN